MSLSKYISDLTDILSRNIDLYEEMAVELIEEQNALKAHSFAAINASLKRKESITLKIRTLEETRLRVTDKILKHTKLDPKELTLVKLQEYATAPLKDRLAQIRASLKHAIEKTNELNYFNHGLIEKLMKINYDSAIRLQRLTEADDTYEKGGKSPTSLKTGRVVSQTM